MQRLELTWIGKGNDPRVEPRILLHDPSKDYGDPTADNMLIHGDNLLVLKALEQEFSGKVKCIYIDPPYNTGNAFDKYDDSLEHSIWLNLMKQRIEILHNLLSIDGVFFCNLDEQEHAYLKVLLDEIFGRKNYIGDIIWKKRKGGGNDSRFIALDHDYILVYVKNASKEVHKVKWRVSQSEEYLKRYREVDENGNRYYWDTLARDGLQNPIPVTVKCPDGTNLSINSQKSQSTIEDGLSNGTIRLTQSRNGWTLHHRVYMPVGQVLRSMIEDVGTNKTAGDEIGALFGDTKAFPYPKPESLIMRLLELNTNPGDLILDSFLGSGTTAAVAHKMGRRYIGIELGNHCYTHCLPRLKAVVDGEQGGISENLEWKGGGGFKFYELAPTLLVKDSHGNSVFSDMYNPQMLVAAVAKINGFTYSPNSECFWKQGIAQGNSFIYVTTQYVTAKELDDLARDLSEYEKLLICAPAFDIGLGRRYENIDVRKIPQSVLAKCEYGVDNYDLNIVNPLELDEEEWDDVEQ
ncbi:MAG: site-specific DNA-methyltransferase [Erysipelotrichaceae bacterium]|nr:site-specific DNA-methyltransferase [Erysipelotrichaceae bacterium]